MATWLVTGGCGFIGSHLVDALVARGDRVRVVDDLSLGRRENLDRRAELLVGDAADAGLARRAMEGVDGCFHLAAIASVEHANRDWLGAHRANQTASVAVLDAARAARPEAPPPVVYASSAAVYGDVSSAPLAETMAVNPTSAYGADKAASEMHARVAWHVHRVPTVGLRFFNIYGPRQDARSPYSGVIAVFADRIAAGQRVEIHGDGRQVRDFVFVADAVRALLSAMDTARAGARVYNVCTGVATAVDELARCIGRIYAAAPPIAHLPPRPGDIRVSVGDPARAAEALGFRTTIDVSTGLRGMLIDTERQIMLAGE